MGIEYLIVNLDRREFLDFDRLGFGTKIGGITSEPISSFLSWLLIDPEGYGDDMPKMLGRWAGNRIAIIGDEENGHAKQEEARRDFKDITIEIIAGYAADMPFERLTILQPMGLIDKGGNVVVEPRKRELVASYWKSQEASE